MSRPTERARTEEPLPRAKIRQSFFQWAVWGFPIVAAIFLGGLIYRDQLDKARQVTVLFKNVDGVEADNTMVKCRGATVGTVKHVVLTQDHQWVAVGVDLVHGQENLARQGALFWVVKAQFSAAGLTGLETVMSGSYLDVRPGSGPPTNSFVGAEEAPIAEMPEPGALSIVLLASNLNSIQEGSPIFYRGIQAGRVVDFQLGDDARQVVVHAQIRKPYSPLVRQDSVFWNAGGIDVHFGLFRGLDVSAESARALVGGAIEFATPDIYEAPATDGATFGLFEKQDDKWKAWHPNIPLTLPPEATRGAPFATPNLPPTTLQK